jgi:3'-phosphoadenosine 5'-phosphosulfate sulfotransferase (PAPS reductase)/FAD synthetase
MFQWEFCGAEQMPIRSGVADIVLFAYSFGFVDQARAISEAYRVLKADGELVFFEPTGADAVFADKLGYRSFVADTEFIGFARSFSMTPKCSSEHTLAWLAEVGEDDLYHETFARCQPTLTLYRKIPAPVATLEEVFARHEKVALSYSGGKDSTACLYLLEPYWDRVVVYWLNTGDTLPETQDLMDQVRAKVANFVEVRTDVLGWRKVHGMPSDLVPTNNGTLGRMLGFGETKIVDRFRCCQENIMEPLYARLLADGVSCLIRGQKNCDMPDVPHRSGEISPEGVELFYPLDEWSHDDVMRYLQERGALVHPCYANGNTVGVDCAHCTGWWHESHFDFLKARHPVIWAEVRDDLTKLKGAIEAHLAHFPEGV